VHPNRFVATFLHSGPETLVTDDSSRQIYDRLCRGFIKADKVYLALNDRQRTLRKDTDSSICIHAAKIRREHDRSWTATLEHLNDNDCILWSTVEQISTNVAFTACLAADLLPQKTLLDEINNQVQIQSSILNTITRNNKDNDAHMKEVEGCLADGDAHLTCFCNTTEATTSSLRTDINIVHARFIPYLRCDIN
jgi:hypothetical protein